MFAAAAYVLFCLGCAVLAFRRHPIFGFYFYLASIYVHPPSRWWGYMIPDLRWALLSAGITALAIALNRGRLRARPVWLANPPAILLGLYTLWMCVQIPWALDTSSHIEGIVKFVKYLMVFWMVYRLTDTTARLRDLMAAHASGCALLGIFAQFIGREGDRLDGVGGPGIDDANTLGMVLGTGALACMGLFLTLKGWRRWVALAMLGLIANGFVLANSRGAFLGLVAGSLVFAFCKAREHSRMFWTLAAVGSIGFAVAVDQAFVARMFTIGDVTQQENDEADMSARSRMVIYEAQLKMAFDYPLGAGYRGTAELSPMYMDRQWLVGGGADADAGRASHNTFMTTLVEQGVPGALLFIVLVSWIVVTAFRVRSYARRGDCPDLGTLGASLCGGLATVIVAGAAADYLMAEVQFLLFAALVSMLELRSHAVRAGPAAAIPASPASPVLPRTAPTVRQRTPQS